MITMPVKTKIKVLANLFEHTVEYAGNVIYVYNQINRISLQPGAKEDIVVSYNYDYQTDTLNLSPIHFIDTFIDLLTRNGNYKVQQKPGSQAIDLRLYYDLEGNEALEDVSKLLGEFKEGCAINKNLRGNRINAKYFEGYILFIDSLNDYNASLIDIKELI